MSACTSCSALGIYSLCPGKPDWVLGAPLFEEADMPLPEDMRFALKREASNRERSFNHVTLNGAEVREAAVRTRRF